MRPSVEGSAGDSKPGLPFSIGSLWVGGAAPLLLVAGPCVIESRAQSLEAAQALKETALAVGVSLIFKSSYDKANRTSLGSYRGPGLSLGLEILAEVREACGIPVLSDVHCRTEVEAASQVLDVIQIPAFLCRQTDLLLCAARTGRVINVKKGQFLGPWDMGAVLEKIWSTGNRRVLISERGTTFGYQNLVVDFRSLAVLRRLGAGLLFDATHSVQLPGGQGHASGGEREFVPSLSKAAVAVGVDGLFLEVHPDPDRARCDGPNSLPLLGLKDVLREIVEIHDVVKKQASGRG